jgi:peptide/nickel transport system permease protein
MGSYVLKRLFHSLLVILGISFFTFSLLQMSGDPVALLVGQNATPQEIEEARGYYGFNDPFIVQYFNYLKKLVRFDFGTSYRRQVPVIDLILEYFPNTLMLATVAYIIAMFLAIPMGVIAAIRKDTVRDFSISTLAMLGQAIPVYWSGLIFIIVFSVTLRWLPAGGSGFDKHIILPALVLVLFSTARVTRMSRSSMLEVLNQDYIRTAKSQGIKPWRINFKYALKSASIPIVTLIGMEYLFLLEGTFIVETIFSWPGVGLLTINSVYTRDYPVVQGTVIFITFIILFLNLFVDILYTYLDPRIRYGKKTS